MDFYYFHQKLYRLKHNHKYLYILIMTYVVLFIAIISSGCLITPVLLGFFINPWLGLTAIITIPIMVLFIAFVFELFDM